MGAAKQIIHNGSGPRRALSRTSRLAALPARRRHGDGNDDLGRRYLRLKEGYNKPHNVVVVAIARELVGFIWGVLQPAVAA